MNMSAKKGVTKRKGDSGDVNDCVNQLREDFKEFREETKSQYKETKGMLEKIMERQPKREETPVGGGNNLGEKGWQSDVDSEDKKPAAVVTKESGPNTENTEVDMTEVSQQGSPEKTMDENQLMGTPKKKPITGTAEVTDSTNQIQQQGLSSMGEMVAKSPVEPMLEKDGTEPSVNALKGRTEEFSEMSEEEGENYEKQKWAPKETVLSDDEGNVEVKKERKRRKRKLDGLESPRRKRRKNNGSGGSDSDSPGEGGPDEEYTDLNNNSSGSESSSR